MKVYQADCDEFDNHRTGYHDSEKAAEAAFWNENQFTASELKRVRVYTREHEVTAELREDAIYLASQGSPSPALSIEC